MALWQFVLYPIPASKISQFAFDDDDIQEMQLSSRDRSALSFRLAAILPPGDPWDGDMRHWGDEERDDISFFMSDAGVEGLRVRVDVANLSVTFVSAICTLGRDFGWAFVSEAGEIIEPFPESVLKAINQSPAREYVRDPAAFLARVARDHKRRN